MKIAVIIDEALPNGLAANTAAVMGISLGAMYPEIVRESAYDADGNEFTGITSLVIPILSTEEAMLKSIAQKVQEDGDVTLIPFTKVAQRSKNYDTYKKDLQKTSPEVIQYSGIALVGSNKKVASYTGSLPLLK